MLSGAGYKKAHLFVDHASLLALVKVLPYERNSTKVGFRARVVFQFSQQGITCSRILSDGPAYVCAELSNTWNRLRVSISR